jgi:hypothetical protein
MRVAIDDSYQNPKTTHTDIPLTPILKPNQPFAINHTLEQILKKI